MAEALLGDGSLKGKLFLVTGGTGFLGYHLIQRLTNEGAYVRVFARKSSREIDNIPGTEHFAGSILDQAALVKAAEGCDGIFHLAGLVIHSRQPEHEKEVFETNITGTMNVMKAAKIRKLRVVYASTSGTVGCSKDRAFVATDDSPFCDDVVSTWPYYRSKIESEVQALEYASRHLIPLVILRPTMMFGPEDFYLRATTTIQKFINRKIPFIPAGGASFVDVRDVATAFRHAMVIGRPGHTYLLGSKNLTVEEMFIMIEKASGVPRPKLKLPGSIARPAAVVLDAFNRRIRGRWDPGVDPVKVEMANHFWNIDWAKAKRELKFRPRSPEQTIRDTVDWLRDNQATIAGQVPVTVSSKRSQGDPDDEEEEDSAVEYAPGQPHDESAPEDEDDDDGEQDRRTRHNKQQQMDADTGKLRAKL